MNGAIGNYYRLTKPGIVYGNSIPLIAAFIYGSSGSFSIVQLLFVVFGAALVIAAACVCNNILERKSDALMDRTNQRALVNGDISLHSAKLFAIVLVVVGFGLLTAFSNQFAVFSALIGFMSYVLIYTPLKQVTYHSTLVGTIPGAMPPVIGYTAATGTVDIAALLFFLTLVFWQMPHFYAIAIRRKADYAHARLPTVVSAKGVNAAMSDSIIYGCLLLTTIVLTQYVLEMSLAFILIVVAVTLWVIMMTVYHNQSKKWAKMVFPFSLLILILWSGLLAIEGLIL